MWSYAGRDLKAERTRVNVARLLEASAEVFSSKGPPETSCSSLSLQRTRTSAGCVAQGVMVPARVVRGIVRSHAWPTHVSQNYVRFVVHALLLTSIECILAVHEETGPGSSLSQAARSLMRSCSFWPGHHAKSHAALLSPVSKTVPGWPSHVLLVCRALHHPF